MRDVTKDSENLSSREIEGVEVTVLAHPPLLDAAETHYFRNVLSFSIRLNDGRLMTSSF